MTNYIIFVEIIIKMRYLLKEVENMIKMLSNNITNLLVTNSVINDEIEIYRYGIELIISSIIGITGILIISILTNHMIEGCIYLIAFVSIRKFTGGYHCKTYFACKACFIGLFVIYLFISLTAMPSLFMNILYVISFISIWLLAPCDHENKPFSEKEFIRYGNISKFIISIYSLLIVIMYQYFAQLVIPFELVLIIIACLLIIGKIERRITYEKE